MKILKKYNDFNNLNEGKTTNIIVGLLYSLLSILPQNIKSNTVDDKNNIENLSTKNHHFVILLNAINKVLITNINKIDVNSPNYKILNELSNKIDDIKDIINLTNNKELLNSNIVELTNLINKLNYSSIEDKEIINLINKIKTNNISENEILSYYNKYYLILYDKLSDKESNTSPYIDLLDNPFNILLIILLIILFIMSFTSIRNYYL